MGTAVTATAAGAVDGGALGPAESLPPPRHRKDSPHAPPPLLPPRRGRRRRIRLRLRPPLPLAPRGPSLGVPPRLPPAPPPRNAGHPRPGLESLPVHVHPRPAHRR